MTTIPMAAKLLRASQQAYNVLADGPQPIPTPFDQIGWVGPPFGMLRGGDGIHAFLFGQTDTESILAFRGSLTDTSNSPDRRQVVRDWLNNFDAALVPGADLTGLVHQGFLEAIDVLWPDIVARLDPSKPLYVTGHSKGGALANLAASRLARLNLASPVVTTFAAAKPGDVDFQTAYNDLVPHSIRYENRDDIVPHLPPSLDFRRWLGDIDIFKTAGDVPWIPLPPGSDGFAGVGDLMFIDWFGAILSDSTALKLKRYLSLILKAGTADIKDLVDDHRIGDDFDYAKAALPEALRTHIDQAVVGVSAMV